MAIAATAAWARDGTCDNPAGMFYIYIFLSFFFLGHRGSVDTLKQQWQQLQQLQRHGLEMRTSRATGRFFFFYFILLN